MGVPGKVRQFQYLELLGREGVQGLPDLVALRVPPGLRERLTRLGALGRGFDPFLRLAPARLGAELVYAAIVDYGENPGPHAPPLRPIAARTSPDFQERVLSQVLGRLTFPHHPVSQGEGRLAVAVVERRESVGVARLDKGDQILVRKNKVLSSPVSHVLILR